MVGHGDVGVFSCFCLTSFVGAVVSLFFFFLMIRRPPRSTLDRSSAASDVYKRQVLDEPTSFLDIRHKLELLTILKDLVHRKRVAVLMSLHELDLAQKISDYIVCCLLYTSDAADERSSVDLRGRRSIKKKNTTYNTLSPSCRSFSTKYTNTHTHTASTF